MPRPKIGLLPTGHEMYWGQFPGLREKCLAMLGRFREKLDGIGEVIVPPLVDTPEKARAAGELFQREKVDLVLIFPLGYTTGMVMVPAVRELDVPLRILNAHLDATYDYKTADTAEYLYHEGPCCVPEYAGTLVQLGMPFTVRSGWFGDARLWQEAGRRLPRGGGCPGVSGELNFGVIGNTYTNMTDMPTDEHRVLRATGRLLKRPEVEEIEEAFHRVTDAQLQGHVSAVPRDVRRRSDGNRRAHEVLRAGGSGL